MADQSKVRDLEQEIQDVIDRSPHLKGLSERDWCETITEALGGIIAGKEMRLQELQNEEGE